MDVPAGFRGELAGGRAEIMQQRQPARLDDGVDGIEPQPVEAIVAQPGQRILDRKGADFRHAIIDRAAPGRLRFGEEGRRIAAEIIPLGAEMVIDDVEKHHQPAQMRLVDQRLEIVGPAIGAVGRVPQHAVIAPVARAGEIRQRHQFQRGDAGLCEMIEPVDHGAIGAFLGEGADMGLEDHGLLPRPPAPVRGAPWIGLVIDHLARAEDVFGLKGRRRIGHVDLVIDAEFVARAGLARRRCRP